MEKYEIDQMRKALINKENCNSTHSYEDKRLSGNGAPTNMMSYNSKRNSSQFSESHYQYTGIEKKIKVYKRECKKSDPEEQHKRYVNKVLQDFNGGTASPSRNM